MTRFALSCDEVSWAIGEYLTKRGLIEGEGRLHTDLALDHGRPIAFVVEWTPNDPPPTDQSATGAERG